MDVSNNTFFIENKEAYVSFETAKLLQKKGFDWFTYYSYEEYDGKVRIRLTTDEDTGRPTYAAPTQQMACRWLRENRYATIAVIPYEISPGRMEYVYKIWIKEDEKTFRFFAQGRAKEYKDQTQEEVTEAAILYCLKEYLEL